MSWTDERIGLLKKMWKDGKSAAEIAKSLGRGVTRNAVIGKANRMGLSNRSTPAKKPAALKKELPRKGKAPAIAVPARKGAAPAPAPAVRGKSATPTLPVREAEEIKNLGKEIMAPGGGVPLIDLTERMCKWPIGDPREDDFTFCGRTAKPGIPYCPEHGAMAYQTSSRRHAISSPAAAAAVPVANEDKEVDEAVDGDEEEEVAVT